MKRTSKRVISYLMVLAMILGIFNVADFSSVNAEVPDVNRDLIKMMAVLVDEDLSTRQKVLEIITTDEGKLDTSINEVTAAVDIGKITLKSGALLSTKVSVATVESGLKDAKAYYNNSSAYAAYVNYALDKLGQELQSFSNKEDGSNELVARIEIKALSYKLFLNFLNDIKGMTGIKPLDYYKDNKELDINPEIEVLLEALKGITGLDQIGRFDEYKDLLVNDYLVEVNRWTNQAEKDAFISDLNELGLYNEKYGGLGGVGAPTTTPVNINDGTVATTTNSQGEKVSTVTINDQAVDKDIANAQTENISLDLTEVKGSKEVNVELAGAMIDKIADSSKGIEIKSENAVLLIPEDVAKQISQTSSNEKITISINVVKVTPALIQDGIKVVAQILDFSIKAGEKKIENFDSKIKAEIKTDLTKINDHRKVIASYYNEVTKQWEPVNGYMNKQTGALVFFVDHFSKYTAMEYQKSFEDVDTPWAKVNIEVLAARNIMNGKSQGKFDPKANITRAEVAAIITRALHLDTKATTDKFFDVTSGKWYAKEVEAAANAGIVGGMGNGKFAPDAQITREQIATMICRALEYKQGKITSVPAATFTDASSISSFAKDAVSIAAHKNIIKGSYNKFDPKDKATREQVAVMIYRLLEALGQM